MGRETFNCIDVETANADRASICQIGIVQVRDGGIRDRWATIVDPEDWFDPWNTHIHGIGKETVEGMPTMPDVYDELRRRLDQSIIVSHTGFDRNALERALAKYGLEPLRRTRWLDSARVARCAWPDRFGQRGYALNKVAAALGIKFRHHDALEDARAAAEIVLRACNETGFDPEAWLSRVEQRSGAPRSGDGGGARREGNADGPLFGETVVFTGTLGVPRREAAVQAARLGCAVTTSVSKKVTMLVVGIQDRRKLRGYGKSSKHRDAEALIARGQDIEILSEADFAELVRRVVA